MDLIAEHDQYFPTSTPILDVHRPVALQPRDKLSTGNCVFLSSAVIVAFTALSYIRSLYDSFSAHPWLFWVAFLAAPVLAFVTTAMVHEAGHLGVAGCVGFKPVQVKFGPLRLRSRSFNQGVCPEQVFTIGSLVLTPEGAADLRRRLFYLVLGGPVGNVCFTLLLETGLNFFPIRPTAASLLTHFGVHVLAAASLLVCVAALVPDLGSNGEFSDGARLLMLAKDNALAARWLAIVELQLALNAGVRPRDWDEALVGRALTGKDKSLDTAAASWLAYQWALSRQEITLATRYLEETLANLSLLPNHLRDRIFIEAAAFQAWFRHNAGKGRFWVSQIRDPKSAPLLNKIRMEIALGWAEGKLFDAWEKLGEYLRLLQQLPQSPVRDLAEKNALEWKSQMESRMVAGAWAMMHAQESHQPSAFFATDQH